MTYKRVKLEPDSLKIIWEDIGLKFMCFDCGEPIYIEKEFGPYECDCGRVYELDYILYELYEKRI